MSLNQLDASSPVEIWLTQKNMEITCMVVFDDETTESIEVESLSMRGAQREITGYLLGQGYEPSGRWSFEQEGETVRQFKPAKEASK